MDKKYIFICGLHRSGKSTLTKIISTSNLVSIHFDKNSSDIEGQHIQTVYEAAYKHGGPGKFGFDKKYHYTEKTHLLTQKNNDKIINEWSKYWDLNKPILIEQSPPNIRLGGNSRCNPLSPSLVYKSNLFKQADLT